MSVQGEDWKALAQACADDAFSIDREALTRIIALCDGHADAMQKLADRATRELYVDRLGIGEEYLESARLLTQKFRDKAIGGGQIVHENSAVGLFESHRDWAMNMGNSFRAALKRYEEQDVANAAGYRSVGDAL